MLAFFMAALIPIPALRYFAIQVNAIRVHIYVTTLIEVRTCYVSSTKAKFEFLFDWFYKGREQINFVDTRL